MITELGLKLIVQWEGTRPYGEREQDCWDLRICLGRRRFRTPFYSFGEPALATVLACLKADAEVARLSFELWSQEQGVTGQEAKRFHAHCMKQTERVRLFFGSEYWRLEHFHLHCPNGSVELSVQATQPAIDGSNQWPNANMI